MGNRGITSNKQPGGGGGSGSGNLRAIKSFATDGTAGPYTLKDDQTDDDIGVAPYRIQIGDQPTVAYDGTDGILTFNYTPPAGLIVKGDYYSA